MENTFVTLQRTDPKFHTYLDGSFSQRQRALPVYSVNINSDRERITFRVLELESIQRPAWWLWAWRLVRPQWSTLALSPMAVTWVFLAMRWPSPMNWGACALAALAVFCLQAAAFLLNDYSDYVQGVDRLRPKDDRDFVKKGWVRARTLYRAGWVGLAMGAFLGLPLIGAQPYFLVLAGLAGGFAVFGYSYRNYGWKYLGLGDFTVFLCLGPMVTYAASRVAVESHPWQVYLLGAMFGHLAMVALQARQLTNIMADGQAGIRTLAVRLGFDRAQKMILVQLAVSAALVAAVWAGLKLPPWSVAFFTPFAFELGRMFTVLQGARSPLSSTLTDLHVRLSRLHLYLALALALALVF